MKTLEENKNSARGSQLNWPAAPILEKKKRLFSNSVKKKSIFLMKSKKEHPLPPAPQLHLSLLAPFTSIGKHFLPCGAVTALGNTNKRPKLLKDFCY